MAADEVGVLQIYGSAREKQGTVSGQDLAKKIFTTTGGWFKK